MDMSYLQKQVPGLIRNCKGRLRGSRFTYDTGAEAMTRPPLVRPEWVSSDELNPKAFSVHAHKLLPPLRIDLHPIQWG